MLVVKRISDIDPLYQDYPAKCSVGIYIDYNNSTHNLT